jgi:hypothetical protein
VTLRFLSFLYRIMTNIIYMCIYKKENERVKRCERVGSWEREIREARAGSEAWEGGTSPACGAHRRARAKHAPRRRSPRLRPDPLRPNIGDGDRVHGDLSSLIAAAAASLTGWWLLPAHASSFPWNSERERGLTDSRRSLCRRTRKGRRAFCLASCFASEFEDQLVSLAGG